jgi:hypothetical protein
MRETSTSEGGNYPPILPVGLNLQESRWDFFICLSAGFEPANSGSSGQYANHWTTEAVLSVVAHVERYLSTVKVKDNWKEINFHSNSTTTTRS